MLLIVCLACVNKSMDIMCIVDTMAWIGHTVVLVLLLCIIVPERKQSKKSQRPMCIFKSFTCWDTGVIHMLAWWHTVHIKQMLECQPQSLWHAVGTASAPAATALCQTATQINKTYHYTATSRLHRSDTFYHQKYYAGIIMVDILYVNAVTVVLGLSILRLWNGQHFKDYNITKQSCFVKTASYLNTYEAGHFDSIVVFNGSTWYNQSFAPSVEHPLTGYLRWLWSPTQSCLDLSFLFYLNRLRNVQSVQNP